ncbi:exopolysaccharide transport family protein [Pseudomonadota bacterium]
MSSITHLPPPGGHPQGHHQGNTLPTLYQQHGVAVYNPYTQPEYHDDEIDLRKLWRIVSKYRWTIIAVFLISVVTTGIVSLLTQPVYRASALIEVQPDRSIVKFQNLDQQNLTDREYLTTQMNILSSESVSNAVIDGMDLPKDPEFNGEFAERGLSIGLGAVKDGIKSALEAVRSLFGGESVGTGDVVETSMFQVPPEVIKRRELLQRYQDKLNVSQVTKSDLIRVSMDSYSPAKAATLANAHTEAYVLLSENRRFDSTSGAKSFLQKQIEESQANLEASEKALTDFARKRNIVDVEDRSNYMETRLSELNQALTETKQARITAEVAYRQAEKGDIGSIPTVLEGQLVKVLREDLAEFEAEYREKSRVFKDTYPAMQQLKAKIDDLHASLDRESQRLVVGLQNKYEQLVAEEIRLEEQVDKQQGQMLDLKDRAIAYNIPRWLDVGERPVLTEYLTDTTKADIVNATRFENLCCISSGGHDANSTELLSSKKIDEYVKTLSGYFDYVIFDGPPSSHWRILWN